jgi:hypothetical protein
VSDIDEQVITRAAEAAVSDLQLDCRIEKVFQHPRNNDRWCIQFTGDYGQFCDEFRNKSGEENSPELIREKVKSHFLKMRKPVRVRRGRSPQTGSRAQGSTLAAAPLELVGQAIDQTTRLVGEVVNQVSSLARSALDTEAVVSIDLPVASTLPPPARQKSKKAKRPSKGKPGKSSSGKSTKKKNSSAAGKTTSKAGKAAKKVARKSRATVGSKTSGRKGR